MGDPMVRLRSAPGGLCSSEAVTDLARPVWPVSIPSCQWESRARGLCPVRSVPGLAFPYQGQVPVVVEDLAGSAVMTSSPLPWFLPSPALSPFLDLLESQNWHIQGQATKFISSGQQVFKVTTSPVSHMANPNGPIRLLAAPDSSEGLG